MKRFFRPAILIAAVIFLTGNCVAQRRTYDTLAGDKKAVERLFTAWNSRDTEKVLAAFSEDAVYEDVAIDQVYRGRAQIRKWVAEPSPTSRTLSWRSSGAHSTKVAE
jgi:hypothetical protein